MFCPHCGKEIAEVQSFCQNCGGRIAGLIPPVHAAFGREKTPWEDREKHGFSRGLYMTVKKVLFSPSDFYKKMMVSGGINDPLLYGLIIGMIGLISLNFWDVFLRDALQSFMTPEMKAATGHAVFQGTGSAVTALMTPFVLIGALFIVSGMLHVFLWMARGAASGFEATFRVVGYSVSPFLFMVIPYFGFPISLFWTVTLVIIGLRDAHGTTGGRAAFAVFLPFILFCGLMALFAILFIGALTATCGALMRH